MSELPHRRKAAERFVAYIPAENVAKIKEPSLVVSIKGAHNDRPEINEQKHHVFKLDFDVGDWAVECSRNLQEQQVIDLLAFIELHKDSGRDLYIHCTEGRIRSYTIAKLLQREGLFYIDRANKLLGPGQCLDREACNTFNGYIEKLEKLAEEEPEQVVGTVAPEHVYTQ